MPTMAKKIQKMRFVFEEDTQDDNDDQPQVQRIENQKYKGYVDETYAADSNGASYALMIYDVRQILWLQLTFYSGQEKHFQTSPCRKALQIRKR